MFSRVPITGEEGDEVFAVTISDEIDQLLVVSNQELELSLPALQALAELLGAKLKRSPHLVFYPSDLQVMPTNNTDILVPLDMTPNGADGPRIITTQTVTTGIAKALQLRAQLQERNAGENPAGINALANLAVGMGLTLATGDMKAVAVGGVGAALSFARMLYVHLSTPEGMQELPDLSGIIPPVELVPADPPYAAM